MALFSSNTVFEIKQKIYGFFIAWLNWGIINIIGALFIIFVHWIYAKNIEASLSILLGLSVAIILHFFAGVFICFTTRYVVNVKERKIDFYKKRVYFTKRYASVHFLEIKNASIIQLKGDACILFLYLEDKTDGFVRTIVRETWFSMIINTFKHWSECYLGGLPMSTCLEIVEMIQRDADIDHPAPGDS